MAVRSCHLSAYDVLEMLDIDDGLYSEDERDCEAEGISGYISGQLRPGSSTSTGRTALSVFIHAWVFVSSGHMNL